MNVFFNMVILNINDVDGSLAGTTTLVQSGPGSNGNEAALSTLQTSRTRALLLEAV